MVAGSVHASFLATTVSYIYRWGQQGVGHISAIGNNENSLTRFMSTNRDFGAGLTLKGADLTPYWPALLKSARALLAKDDCEAFERRMSAGFVL